MLKVTVIDTEDDEMEWETPEEFALVKKAVFEKGDDFWEGSGGACTIYVEKEGVKGGAKMNIVAREEFGFIISLRLAGQDHSMMLSTGVKDDHIVYPEVSGELDPNFREYCVSKETAWQAIDYFMKTGERNPSLIWTRQRVAE